MSEPSNESLALAIAATVAAVSNAEVFDLGSKLGTSALAVDLNGACHVASCSGPGA